MKMPRKMSLASLSLLLFSATVPTSCDAINPSSSTTQQAVSSSSGALTGVIYTNVNEAGQYVRPVGKIDFTITDDQGEDIKTQGDKTLTDIKVDDAGRFYINNIAIPDDMVKSGQPIRIQIGQLDPIEARLFPNRVVNLGAVQLTTDANSVSAEFVEVGAVLINASTEQPLADVTVRDKLNPNLETKTDAQGAFKFSVTRTNPNQPPQTELIINETTPPIPLDFTKIGLQQGQTSLDTVRVQIDNIRTIQGIVRDQTNSNLAVPNVKVSIDGSDLSTFSDKDGKFVINGAPLNSFILKAEKVEGYTGSSVQIKQAANKGETVEQDVNMRPVGNILVSFTSESAPGIAGGSNCIQGYNCVLLDQSTPPQFNDPRYTNGLAVRNTLEATLNVKSTSIEQKISYPPALIVSEQITLPPSAGLENTKPVTLYDPNQVVSVLLEDVPGGRQTVTLSMTAHQTQKSIDIFVPPADTVSSELIVLHRVAPAKGIGDVKGFVRGIDPEDIGSIKVNFLDISDSQSYQPSAGETVANLQSRIQNSLGNGVSLITTDNDGNTLPTPYFYLRNVPTGTRVMVVAGPIGSDNDCYIPNSAVLLNVEQGKLNFAPDLTLAKRPTADCQ